MYAKPKINTTGQKGKLKKKIKPSSKHIADKAIM